MKTPTTTNALVLIAQKCFSFMRVDRLLIVETHDGKSSYRSGIWTSDSPAVVAAKIAQDNPQFCDMGVRLWINDPQFDNPHPFRFRCLMHNGKPSIRIIDARRR